MIFLDTETCGFHGPTVLIQWAKDDGEINLHSVFTEPVQSTLDLIEMFCFEEDGICGFNLAFDWFHLVQTYTTLALLPPDAYPQDIINDYAIAEERARTEGYCIKPMKALDLMLHARKGEYQSTMDRSDVRIKRVPTPLAWELVEELDKRIPLKDVYFARYSDPSRRWQVMDILDDFGDVIPEFKDVVLKFAPSSALKALAQDALGVDTEKIKLFADVELPAAAMPVELGYAPYALAIGTPENWNGAWPDSGKIMVYISRWTYNEIAREYASDDVKYTRMLYYYFGRPEAGDDDSELACMVGAVRWRGFKIDIDAVNQLKQDALGAVRELEKKFNFNSSAICRKYMEDVLGETEKLVLRQNGKITTKSIILEDIAKWTQEIVCPDCKGMSDNCPRCNGDGLIKGDLPHPAAIRAQEILAARHAKKEVELYDKLLKAGRFHASFKVIGALSNRMSGADGFNPQGIKRTKMVRACFPLADGTLVLSGGDFDSFEISIAEAVYHDPKLREEMLSGKKIHGLFGMELFPPLTYDQIKATKDTATKLEEDLYTRSKNGVFAMLYGGEAYTLVTRVGVNMEVAERAYQNFLSKYPKWGKKRQEYFDMFCSMRQPGGIGSRVEWHEPADFIESMFGFRRYFTLENKICKELFELANEPPKEWTQLKMKVTRRDREQTISGAIRSALFAAAFALQSANMRAAANHVIQSTGATMTKILQRRIWDLQPAGINHWRVQPMNVHDEVMCPTLPTLIPNVTKIVDEFVDEYKQFIPFLKMKWIGRLNSWADK